MNVTIKESIKDWYYAVFIENEGLYFELQGFSGAYDATPDLTADEYASKVAKVLKCSKEWINYDNKNN